jgi:hypothetical protein
MGVWMVDATSLLLTAEGADDIALSDTGAAV